METIIGVLLLFSLLAVKIFIHLVSGINEGMHGYNDQWVVARDLPEYQETFKQIAGSSTKISGSQAKPVLVSYWHLSDTFVYRNVVEISLK